MTNPVGRPRKEDALARTGKPLYMILNKKDFSWLEKMAKEFGLNRTEFIRVIIRQTKSKEE